MLHTIDSNSTRFIVYVIENAIYSYTQAVIRRASKFLSIGWAGIFLRAVNVLAYQASVTLG